MGNTNETKLCKHCQMEIPKKAKICPNCKKKQGGKLKWVIIGVVALLIIGAAAGGGNNDDGPKKVSDTTQPSNSQENDTNDNSEKEIESTTHPAETPTPEVKNEFVVGDVVEDSDLRVSFLSAGEWKSDNQFIQPKDGCVYYRVEFEFENMSNSDKSISSFNFKCYADDYAVDQSWAGDDDISATLSPGKKTKGSVYFEVPVDAESVVVEYETNFWTEKKIIFIIK